MSDPVRYEVARGVAWLTIDRPEARNALSQAVREGLFAGTVSWYRSGPASAQLRNHRSGTRMITMSVAAKMNHRCDR